ncbi:MAG: inorganic phosphate transporter [Planctomycetota bacterium]
MLTALLIVAVLALAYANGANDNFKGVATLYGSSTLSYRSALGLATGATLLGSAVSIWLAAELARSFSGRGLVPPALTEAPAFLAAVAGAGAITVLLATRLALPTSTTHALTGALLGVAAAHHGNLAVGDTLWTGFLRPLLISPVIAVLAAALIYAALHRSRRLLRVEPDDCLCIGTPEPAPAPASINQGGALAFRGASTTAIPRQVRVTIGKTDACATTTPEATIRLGATRLLAIFHGLSGASVCFARAVNDTPKIATLWLAAAAAPSWALVAVTAAIAAGGLFSARRVAETMSRHITTLNPGQGATGNFVTAAIVLGASRLGLPVSTTHVSCGAIIGIGTVSRRAQPSVITQIVLAWVATLPLGALLGAALFTALR